jgi:hypothetical protein
MRLDLDLRQVPVLHVASSAVDSSPAEHIPPRPRRPAWRVLISLSVP